MKKIRPMGRYDDDQQYPTTAEVEAEVEAEAQSGRRLFLKGVLAGVAAVGAGVLPGKEAEAQPRPGPKLLPPGVPPRPHKRQRARPRDNPAIPGGGPAPQPNPRPTKRPCNVGGPVAVTLDVLFAFCHGKTGQVTVTTTDSQVAAKLRTPGEGRRLAAIIKPVFTREASCVWLEQPASRAQVEARVARALTDAYQQALGGEIRPLKVSLAVRSEPRVHPPLPGVPPRPIRSKGCASCSTDASLQDVLLPAGLVALALLATRGAK